MDRDERKAGVKGKRHAYVFYATNDAYAVSALVFVHILRRYGASEDTDVVLLHLSLSEHVLATARSMNVRARKVDPLGRGRWWYYRNCFVKLRIFALEEYERVVFVDADAIPTRSLDYLFEIPMSGRIAAADAYWIGPRVWTSALLVVKPSLELWERVLRRLDSIGEAEIFDMDVVNAEFDGEIEPVPSPAMRLTSEWTIGDRTAADPRTSVVHFTDPGKPWSYSPERVRRIRRASDPFFFDLWDTWWAARDEVIASASPRARIRFAVSKIFSQCVWARKLVDWAAACAF